ncbi:MAG TPA: hypothetical protein VGR54_02795 [Nitrosopumilaceae archaeon]|nr:hypothetical protein [Nitrosopumilaceae archaeon]
MSVLTTFNAYASQELTHFKLEGNGSSFEITDNPNSISLYCKNIFLDTISQSNQLGLTINSDNQLKITEIDIYYNNQEHRLLDSHQDVASLAIKSNVILIDSPNTFHSQIMSSTVDISDANQHLVFLNSTDYKIDVPQGSFVYDIRVDGNPQLTIDGQKFSSLIKLNDKIIEVHFQSEGGRVIPVTGDSMIQSTWDKVEIVSDNYPLNFKINNIGGKIGIAGSDKDIELASTDTLTFEKLQGTIDIENGQNYQITTNSMGFAKSILLNNVDILTKSELTTWFGNPVVQGIISAVVGGAILSVIAFSIRKIRQGDNKISFTLEKFFENGKEYVRILHPSKTVEACLILCNKKPCKWWDDNSILPRHIQAGGGGNVLLPQDAESTNPTIIVMSGKRAIRKMKLKDMVLTHP